MKFYINWISVLKIKLACVFCTRYHMIYTSNFSYGTKIASSWFFMFSEAIFRVHVSSSNLISSFLFRDPENQFGMQFEWLQIWYIFYIYMQVYTIVHILYSNSDLKNYLSIKDLVLTVTAITFVPYCWIFKCTIQ